MPSFPVSPHPPPNGTAPHAPGATPGMRETSVTDATETPKNVNSGCDDNGLAQSCRPRIATGDCDAQAVEPRPAHGEPPPASPAPRAGAPAGAGGGGVPAAGLGLVGGAGVGAMDAAGAGAGAGVAASSGTENADLRLARSWVAFGLRAIAAHGPIGADVIASGERALARIDATLAGDAPDTTAALREWLGLFERGNLPLTVGVQHCIDVTRAALARAA